MGRADLAQGLTKTVRKYWAAPKAGKDRPCLFREIRDDNPLTFSLIQLQSFQTAT